MDLDSKQTRHLYLAGTVAFPTPFPTIGRISIEEACILRRPRGNPNPAEFVVVQNRSDLEKLVYQTIRKEDVAAIFFPGIWDDTDQGRAFRCADQYGVHDFEKGEWFLNPDINANDISNYFNLDIRCRDSGATGIVFVPQDRPVLTHTVVAQSAQAACQRRRRRRRRPRRHACDPPPCDCIEFCDPCQCLRFD